MDFPDASSGTCIWSWGGAVCLLLSGCLHYAGTQHQYGGSDLRSGRKTQRIILTKGGFNRLTKHYLSARSSQHTIPQINQTMHELSIYLSLCRSSSTWQLDDSAEDECSLDRRSHDRTPNADPCQSVLSVSAWLVATQSFSQSPGGWDPPRRSVRPHPLRLALWHSVEHSGHIKTRRHVCTLTHNPHARVVPLGI